MGFPVQQNAPARLTLTHQHTLLRIDLAASGGSFIRCLDTPWCVLLWLMLDGAFEERPSGGGGGTQVE